MPHVPLAKPACLIALVAFGVTCARAEAGRFMIGVGASSCGTWLTKSHDRDWDVLNQWVVGFVSGANLFGENDIIESTGVDYYALTSWMDNYCKAHPLDKIQWAAAKLVVELREKAATRGSK
jgi:hypothetical protein